MKPLVLYVLGEPGVGKTTLVRALLRDALDASYAWPDKPPLLTFTEPPNPKWTLAGDTVAAGYYKGEAFDGADTIPYNGARVALDYWRLNYAKTARLTILDGARFATKPSLAYLRECGAHIVGVHLVGPDLAQGRRTTRCAAAGTSPQDPSWVKGAATGARNFAALIGATNVSADRTPGELTDFTDNAIAHARKCAA